MSRKALLKLPHPTRGGLGWSKEDQEYYYFSGDKKYKVRLIEVDPNLPFSQSTLPGLTIEYRQDRLRYIETGGTFDKSRCTPEALSVYLCKTFGDGTLRYYPNTIGSGSNPTPKEVNYFEWQQPKTKQTVNIP